MFRFGNINIFYCSLRAFLLESDNTLLQVCGGENRATVQSVPLLCFHGNMPAVSPTITSASLVKMPRECYYFYYDYFIIITTTEIDFYIRDYTLRTTELEKEKQTS